ncbi:MAG TPA: hypothetical protein VNO81_13750 [Candidatus Nitrosotenuis sp.]|jgi:hypothetical protein|nr:hypothetical protein [Candidatus Nitrosotenuis sp.]
MEDLLALPQLEPAWRRVRRRFPEVKINGSPLADARLADALAREVHEDKTIPDPVRCQALRSLVGLGPGGLLALSWLARHDQVSPDDLLDYAALLTPGAPVDQALEEREAVEVTERLMSGVELPRLARLVLSVRLLACQLFSEAGRAAVLRRLLAGPWLVASDRRTLLEWALGADLGQGQAPALADLPEPPVSLLRPALVGLVQQGEEVGAVARYALANLGSWSDSRPAVQGLLDLVERHGAGLPPALRRQILDCALAQAEPALRRRAYQVGAAAEGESFLRAGLRDPDFGVRNWVLGRLPACRE